MDDTSEKGVSPFVIAPCLFSCRGGEEEESAGPFVDGLALDFLEAQG